MSEPIQAKAQITSNATPAIARLFRQPLHFARGPALDLEGVLYGVPTAAPSVRQAVRARAISAPEALAAKPHDAQEVANDAFGLSQAKQRQR